MARTASTVTAVLAILALAGSAQAAGGNRNVSPGGEYSFQVESNGRILPTYTHRGKTYIEGSWGEEYQIRVFNRSGQRVEAVVTVDGRDAVSGQVGDYRSQRGYVIEAWSSVLIEGFRTSWSNVAAFRFTDVGDSYAARMGDATNAGVIGVAIFKERVYRPRPIPRPPVIPLDRRSRSGGGGGYGYAPESSASKSAPAPDAEALDGMEGGASREYRSQNLGTQYGDDTYSPAQSTQFVRRNSKRPDALLAARYDDREGLIALGVLPRPRPWYRTKPAPDPFPASPSFAPPPPRYDWE